MKNLLLVFVSALLIVSCQKQASTKLAPTPQNLEDVVLVNKLMDEEVTRRATERRKPKPCPPNNPHCQEPPQPPPPQGTAGCVLLDFDGQQINNWDGQTFYAQPSGLQPNQIADVLARVRLDFSFNTGINITTDESVFNTFQVNKRIRVVSTTTMPVGYQQYGGVAYINSFNWFSGSKEAFVNTQGLGFNTKNISDANSHEAGHTFNNWHQSDWRQDEFGNWYKYAEYFVGDLLMGNSYAYPFPRFGIGRNSNFENQNDTLNVNNSIRL